MKCVIDSNLDTWQQRILVIWPDFQMLSEGFLNHLVHYLSLTVSPRVV